MKNFLTICDTLPASRYVEIPFGTIRISKRGFATCVADFQDVGIARVRFEKLSVTTITYWLPLVVLGNRPSMFMATKLNGSIAENTCSGRLCAQLLNGGRLYGLCLPCGAIESCRKACHTFNAVSGIRQ